MVNTERTTLEKSKWITNSIWKEMNAYWDIGAAKEKSITTSEARLSDCGGLRAHVQLSGQKSYLQIQQEMEIELGRPVSLGEVFIKTYTKPDGTFVDRKVQTLEKCYEENFEAKLTNLEDSETSDGTSRQRKLTIDEENDIFLQSTITNQRGTPSGVGSLSQTHVNRKRKHSGTSSSFNSLQQQLEEAKRKIEEQATTNTREEELMRVSSAQQPKIDQLTLVKRYLSETYPRFLEFMAANSAPSLIHPDPRDSPAAPEDPPSTVP